jgi:hypothetical protein
MTDPIERLLAALDYVPGRYDYSVASMTRSRPMSDPRALLDAYASSPGIPWESGEETVVQQAPAAFAALRAVVDLHKAEHVEGRDADGEEREGDCCLTCYDPWPCPTVQAVTTALEAT